MDLMPENQRNINMIKLALFIVPIFHLVNGQEIVQKTACWNEEFRLDCKWRSVLAIHEAHFSNDLHEVSVSNCRLAMEAKPEPFCKEDIKGSLNKRCSGMSHCRFNFTEDHRLRQCYCKGILFIRYACVPESSITQSCNTKVTGTTGYVSSPGYPRFYPRVQQCGWAIQESKGQEMMLTFLDMDTRPPTRTGVIDNCPDSVTVFEDFHKLRYSCGSYNNNTVRPILTTGKRVHFEFNSLDFMPSRGFLLYFKVHGCPTLEPPKLGYMVYRNKSAALYMCCKDHVFNTTLSNMLHLHCVDDMRWNGTIPECISLEVNITRQLGEIKLDVVEVYMDKNKYLEEILIPVACVVMLIFGHVAAFILAVRIRRNRKSSSTNRVAELGSTNGPSGNNNNNTVASAPPDPLSPTCIPSSETKVPTVSVIARAPTVLITDL